MDLSDRIRAVREGGAVERCHTIPHLRPYSVAAHSWGVCVLIRLLWPDEVGLLSYALFHDVTERWTGDIPSTVIRDHPTLGSVLRVTEARISGQLRVPSEHDLSPEAHQKLKCADRLELWLWTWDEEALGNRNVLGVRDELDRSFYRDHVAGLLPSAAWKFMERFRQEGWRRTEEVMKHVRER